MHPDRSARWIGRPPARGTGTATPRFSMLCSMLRTAAARSTTRPATRTRFAPLRVATRVVAVASDRVVTKMQPTLGLASEADECFLLATKLLELGQIPLASEADERFLLGQLLDCVEPEKAWAERESVLSRIALAARLEQADEFTAKAIISWSEDLEVALGSPTPKLLVPLFSELFAAKMLRSMYVERRHSFKAQRQAAADAAAHLMDSVHALARHAEHSPELADSNSIVGGTLGLAQRMELRYMAQIKALDAEVYRATAFLKEIDGSEARGIEVVAAANEAGLVQKCEQLLDAMRAESLQALLRERADRVVSAREEVVFAATRARLRLGADAEPSS